MNGINLEKKKRMVKARMTIQLLSSQDVVDLVVAVVVIEEVAVVVAVEAEDTVVDGKLALSD